MFQFRDPATFGLAIAAVVFFGILLCLSLGRWIGRRAYGGLHVGASKGIGSLEAAVFALMGLLIAFTFSGALSRFDQRRDLVVKEANAIGTAYLRLDLLPADAQAPLRQTFRSYLDSRIATYRKLPDVAAAQVELARSQALQVEIWAQAVAAASRPANRPGTEALVLAAINEIFDVSTARVAVTMMHPPGIVYAMLVGLALAAALLAGYQSAGDKAADWMHRLAFAGIVALTVYVILDMEYPRMGLVHLEAIDQLLVQLRAGMK